jgi:hypothetical protein
VIFSERYLMDLILYTSIILYIYENGIRLTSAFSKAVYIKKLTTTAYTLKGKAIYNNHLKHILQYLIQN